MKNKTVSISYFVKKIGFRVLESRGGKILAEGEYAIFARIGTLFYYVTASYFVDTEIIHVPLVGTKKTLIKTLERVPDDNLFGLKKFFHTKKLAISLN